MDRPLEHYVQTGSGGYVQFAFVLEPTYKSITIKYYTFLNAFAFAGGLYGAVMTIFYFLKWYGMTVVDFEIAHEFFKRKEAGNYNIIYYWILKVYRACTRFLCCSSLNWPETARRNRLFKTLKDMMDVGYLHRRI